MYSILAVNCLPLFPLSNHETLLTYVDLTCSKAYLFSLNAKYLYSFINEKKKEEEKSDETGAIIFGFILLDMYFVSFAIYISVLS